MLRGALSVLGNQIACSPACTLTTFVCARAHSRLIAQSSPAQLEQIVERPPLPQRCCASERALKPSATLTPCLIHFSGIIVLACRTWWISTCGTTRSTPPCRKSWAAYLRSRSSADPFRTAPRRTRSSTRRALLIQCLQFVNQLWCNSMVPSPKARKYHLADIWTSKAAGRCGTRLDPCWATGLQSLPHRTGIS